MRRRMRFRVVLGLAAAGVVCTASAGHGAAPAGISVRMFHADAIARPAAVAAGHDGVVWFTSERSQTVGQVASAGGVRAVVAHGLSAPGAITTLGNAVWIVDAGSSLARVTPAGRLIEHAAPNAFGIAAGPDGVLWFTTAGESVGRMATSGTVTYLVESEKLRGTYGIVRGPDDAMWVTNYLGSSIARVDRTGTVTKFTAPCVRYPTGITVGPDGALWFADDAGTVDRITTAGRVTCFGDSRRVGHPTAIASFILA